VARLIISSARTQACKRGDLMREEVRNYRAMLNSTGLPSIARRLDPVHANTDGRGA
jgi:hypothetical protein